MVGRRTQAERDAATVEAMYAVVTAAVLATVGFLVVTSPVIAGTLHGRARDGCVTAAVSVAAALFFGRLVLTLLRFERRARLRRQDPWYPWEAARFPDEYGDGAGGAGRGRGWGGGSGPRGAGVMRPVPPHRPRRVVRRAANGRGSGDRGDRGAG